MKIFDLATDRLGINVDYREVLKNLPMLYVEFDKLGISQSLNENINEGFWSNLVEPTGTDYELNQTIQSIDQGILNGFKENIDPNWLNLNERDHNYQWRLHSFSFCSGLLFAFNKTGDINYINIITNALSSWKKKFINEYHPEEIFAWNDHTTANRVFVLTKLFYFLSKNRIACNNQLLVDLKNIILIHIFILSCRNFYSYHTNHGMFQASNAYIACALFKVNFFDIDFKEINFRRLKEEFEFSFTPSSVHKENSPEYHYVVFKSFIYFNDILKKLEVEPKEIISDLDSFIKGALKFLAYSITPHGFLATIGDTEEKVLDELTYLNTYENYSYYLYAISKGTKGDIIPYSACAFVDAGYFFIKTNYPNIPYNHQFYLAGKSGFLSKYHRQNDDCHFVLFGLGDEWLVDGGLYRHEHDDTIREYMRSHYSHNLLMPINTVNIERGMPPSNSERIGWGLTDWLVSRDIVEATLSTKMYSGFLYERHFSYRNPFKLKVLDRIVKYSNEDNEGYYLVYHFPTDKIITILDNLQGIIVKSEKNNLILNITSKCKEITVLTGRALPDEFIQKVSKKYNELIDCQTVVFKFNYNCVSDFEVETEITIKENK